MGSLAYDVMAFDRNRCLHSTEKDTIEDDHEDSRRGIKWTVGVESSVEEEDDDEDGKVCSQKNGASEDSKMRCSPNEVKSPFRMVPSNSFQSLLSSIVEERNREMTHGSSKFVSDGMPTLSYHL